MRRMFSEKQIEGLAQEQSKAVKKDIATLVDADGHNRFIEGDIEIEEITGITKTYGKWSLSGTHLLIVLCLGAVVGTTISGTLANITLPSYIASKIVQTFWKTLWKFSK